VTSRYIATGSICLLAGLLLGRYATPAKVEYRERTAEAKTHETAKQEQHAEARSTITLNGAVITRTITKTIPAPGCAGPVTEKTTERYATKTEQRQEQKQTSGTATSSRTTEARIVERVKVVTERRPAWAVSADGGLMLWNADMRIRGSVEVRPIGALPFWVGIFADPPIRNQTLAVGLRARWEF